MRELPNGTKVRVTLTGEPSPESVTCKTCGKPAGNRYARRKSGEVLEGCVDACHDPYVSARDRATAKKARAAIKSKGEREKRA
jgi:hypothetical protein